MCPDRKVRTISFIELKGHLRVGGAMIADTSGPFATRVNSGSRSARVIRRRKPVERETLSQLILAHRAKDLNWPLKVVDKLGFAR